MSDAWQDVALFCAFITDLFQLTITEDLSWADTSAVVGKAHQHFYCLSRLRRATIVLANFYRCTKECFLTNCMAAWYSSCTKAHKKNLSIVCISTGHCWNRAAITERFYIIHCMLRAEYIIKDITYPGHHLFKLLPSGRCFRLIHTWTDIKQLLFKNCGTI